MIINAERIKNDKEMLEKGKDYIKSIKEDFEPTLDTIIKTLQVGSLRNYKFEILCDYTEPLFGEVNDSEGYIPCVMLIIDGKDFRYRHTIPINKEFSLDTLILVLKKDLFRAFLGEDIFNVIYKYDKE